MRKIHKILDLMHEEISYENDSPLAIDLCRITHSPVHCHDASLEMALCLKGEVNICCNHEWLTLSEGEIYTIVARDIHCFWSDTDNIVAFIHIDTSSRHLTVRGLESSYIACEDITCQPFQTEYIRQVKAMLLALIYKQSFGELDSETAISATNKIARILLDYFNWFNLRDNYPGNKPELYERMLQVIDYCESHYMEKLTISSLAKSVHISENYFSQFFKHCPYGSFSLLLGYVRCFYSQELLLTTEMPVIDISQRCGFSDVKYMYKSFRYWWKMTPKEYRQWFSEYVKTPDRIAYLNEKTAQNFIQSYAASVFSDLLI